MSDSVRFCKILYKSVYFSILINYLLYSTDWKAKSDAQHLRTDSRIRFCPEHPRKVSFCPAEERSVESSPTADERTANFFSGQIPDPKTRSSSSEIEDETEALIVPLEKPSTILKKFGTFLVKRYVIFT